MEKGRCDVLKKLQQQDATYTITNNNIVTTNIPASEDVMTEDHIDLLL